MNPRAELQTIRERIEAATKGPWTWTKEQDGWGDCGPNLDGATDEVIGSWGHDANGIFVGTADAEFIAHARTDLPRLLDAVEKVLELHKPFETRQGALICDHCLGNCAFDESEPVDWPCDTVRAITNALEGK